jgi:ubiquinone/menaquinone biosynthesis C-methylase UbiE
MSAAYDHFDYPSYWTNREYEHKSEVLALKSFLNKIPKINKLLDIGSGYGRLTPIYMHRAEKIILIDPSAKLLSMARNLNKKRKVTFIQSKLENLKRKIKSGTVDLVLLVRVIHHLKDLDSALPVINRLCKNNGYFILEFPNKRHVKAIFSELIKGNMISMFDIFPKEIGYSNSSKSSLPFFNYHPDFIKEKLNLYGFKVIETRSVSNIRNRFLKKHVPVSTLLFIEKHLQKILSHFSFGPSIFILSKKIS